MNNLFAELPINLQHELTETLAEGRHMRVERIVSVGQSSPAGFWYDQDQCEWVVVLKGAAHIRFEGEGESTHLQPGDYLLIPAHRKHRVEWTAPDRPTVWLAVFFEEQ